MNCCEFKWFAEKKTVQLVLGHVLALTKKKKKSRGYQKKSHQSEQIAKAFLTNHASTSQDFISGELFDHCWVSGHKNFLQ